MSGERIDRSTEKSWEDQKSSGTASSLEASQPRTALDLGKTVQESGRNTCRNSGTVKGSREKKQSQERSQGVRDRMQEAWVAHDQNDYPEQDGADFCVRPMVSEIQKVKPTNPVLQNTSKTMTTVAPLGQHNSGSSPTLPSCGAETRAASPSKSYQSSRI